MRIGFWSAQHANNGENRLVGGQIKCGSYFDLIEVIDAQLETLSYTLAEFFIASCDKPAVYGYKKPNTSWQLMGIGQMKDGGFSTSILAAKEAV